MSANPVKPNPVSAKLIKPTRRHVLRAIGAGAIASLAGAYAFPRPAIAALPKVRYTLSWLPTGQYAFLSAAQEKGYWKKRGIDVELSRGYGSLAALEAIINGQFDMGGAQTGASLLSIIKGNDLRMVGTQGYDATLGIIVPESGPVKTPKDLEGRKVGVAAAGAETPFLPAFFKLSGVDASKAKIVALDSKILEQSVMSGVVDGMVATGLSSVPNFVTRDVKTRFFSYAGVGLQFYWVNTLTMAHYLEKNREVVEQVQAGIVDGMKFMLLNPKEVVDIHLKLHPELAIPKNGREYVELGVGMTSVIMTAPESIEHGIGYTDVAKIDSQAKLVKEYGAKPGDKAPPPAKSFVINEKAHGAMLTSAQWSEVKADTKRYASLVGRA